MALAITAGLAALAFCLSKKPLRQNQTSEYQVSEIPSNNNKRCQISDGCVIEEDDMDSTYHKMRNLNQRYDSDIKQEVFSNHNGYTCNGGAVGYQGNGIVSNHRNTNGVLPHTDRMDSVSQCQQRLPLPDVLAETQSMGGGFAWEWTDTLLLCFCQGGFFGLLLYSNPERSPHITTELHNKIYTCYILLGSTEAYFLFV